MCFFCPFVLTKSSRIRRSIKWSLRRKTKVKPQKKDKKEHEFRRPIKNRGPCLEISSKNRIIIIIFCFFNRPLTNRSIRHPNSDPVHPLQKIKKLKKNQRNKKENKNTSVGGEGKKQKKIPSTPSAEEEKREIKFFF